jgi:hypothetical protein
MTPRIILAIAAFLAALICIVSGNVAMYSMMVRMNRILPATEQIGYLGFNPAKILRIFREYRRLYPQGRLNSLCKGFVAAGFAFMIVFAWALGSYLITLQ